MAENIRLDGKLAVISGAGRGLGRAMALALVEAGATVIGADLIGDNLAAVAEEATRLSNAGTFEGIIADIRSAEDCARIVAAADNKGGADILINNA